MRNLLGRWEPLAGGDHHIDVLAVYQVGGREVVDFKDTRCLPTLLRGGSVSLLEAWYRRVDGDPDAEVIAG